MKQLMTHTQDIESKTHDMQEKINDLHGTSTRIRTIISAVRDIAEQTHLLSLNASIEAARAGEQGAGFAVVAKEVSKLSQHTKQTVSDIEKLIGNSAKVNNEVVRMISEVRGNVVEVQSSTAATNEALGGILAKAGISVVSMQSLLNEMNELILMIQGIGDSTNEVAASAEKLTTASMNL